MMYKAIAALMCCSLAMAQEHPVLPGADVTTRGFDMITGVNMSWTNSKPLLPIFGVTFNQGKTFKVPGNPNVWSVPDQLTATNVDRTYEAIVDKICVSYHDYISEESSNFNVGVNVDVPIGVNHTQSLKGSFKYNHESYTYKNIMSQKTKASGYSFQYAALYTVEAMPPFLMPLSSQMAATFKVLPSSIESAEDQTYYNDVVSYFGTHVAMMADYGGAFHLSTFVDDSMFSSHTESWVANQMSLTLSYDMFQISAGGFHNRSDIHIDQEFQHSSETYIFFKGGDPALQSNTTAAEWFKSIPQYPVYLNTTLIGLDQVLSVAPGISGSTAKAELMKTTLNRYLCDAVLPTYPYKGGYASGVCKLPKEDNEVGEEVSDVAQYRLRATATK